jgi:hypothetical protein
MSKTASKWRENIGHSAKPQQVKSTPNQFGFIFDCLATTETHPGPFEAYLDMATSGTLGVEEEPTHNERFITLMDRFMPNWRNRKHVLNSLLVRHETWSKS